MQFRGIIIALYNIAGVIFVLTIGLALGQVRSVPTLTAQTAILPLSMLAAGGGIAAILVAVAALMNQRDSGPAEIVRTLKTVQAQLTELSSKADDIAVSMDRMARPRQPTPSLAEPSTPQNGDQSLGPIHQALEEIRELALLTDDQRRERWMKLKEERKLADIRRGIECVQRRQWAQAQQILTAVETEWPGDPATAKAREALEEARVNAQAESLAQAEADIESEMSLSHWDQALETARSLAADFPTSARAVNLLSRVQREKGIYTETTVQRLFEEIRHNIERREWRRGLMHAQKLLEKFPDHSKSEKIRQQLKTIQDNAEIEERQQQEVRIGELIRSRRFNEAIQLGEDLLQRFPMSPQAEAIEIMLPRIRQLASEAEEPAAAEE